MTRGLAKKLAFGLVAALCVLQHDFWFRADRSLVLGFMPVGLLYQVLVSLAAGLAWALVVRLAWPSRLEEWASAGERGGSGGA